MAQNAGPYQANVSASSGLPISLIAINNGPQQVCYANGSTIYPQGVGTCTVQALQPGNSSFAAAPPVTRAFNITAATGGTGPAFQSINFPPAAAQTVNTAFTVAATATSQLQVSFAIDTPQVCAFSNGANNYYVGPCLGCMEADNCTYCNNIDDGNYTRITACIRG